MGLTFGLGSLFSIAACDDSGGDSDTGGNTGTMTTGTGTTGGGALPGTPIPFMDGWAAFDQNTVGIQGAFYTFGDFTDMPPGTSTIMPADFAMAGAEICASGSAGQVMDGADGLPAYSQYWGAAVGFNLSQEVGVDTPLPYDATANNVVGFAFTIGGTNPTPLEGELRFNVKVNGDTNNYCATIPAAGNNEFMLTELYQSCWDRDTSAPTPDPSKLEALHWQYVTKEELTYTFDICITALSTITG